MKQASKSPGSAPTKCLIIVYSYHHNSTRKIAEEFAKVLDAKVVTPDRVILSELEEYDLIGFGAGIDSGMHYKPLLDLAAILPETKGKLSFIFSTSAIQGENKVAKDHLKLRQILQSKGYSILSEFSCKGFNTNSFLKFFGGMNKGKPDNNDLQNAKEFAMKILQGYEKQCRQNALRVQE